jgi:HD-like signal output (HDOD) protein
MKQVDDIINKIDTIPPMPRVINRILRIAADPGGTITDLATIVKHDLTLTANLLKICNSAYYGFRVHVDSIDHAVHLLGINKIVELSVICGVEKTLSNAQKGYGLKRGELWQCSVASALLAKSFTKQFQPELDRYLIYTAALIKDIGKVVIEGFVARAIARIEGLVNHKDYSFDEAETEVLGINHAQLGGLIAEKWNFSPKMVYIIRNHHLGDPDARADLETIIIYLVDTVSRMAEAGIGADGLAYRVYDEIFGRLGLSESDVDELMTTFLLNLNIAKRLFHSI